MSFIVLTRPSSKEIRVDRLQNGSPVDSLTFRAMKGAGVKKFFKDQESLIQGELRASIMVLGAERIDDLKDDGEYVLETYYDFLQEGLDRYRVEERNIEEIADEIRDKERMLSIQGREVTSLDDLF